MIKRINTLKKLEKYKDELINLYIKCFAEYPWNENHRYEEVEQWFKKMIEYKKNISLIFIKNNLVLGATFCFPVKFHNETKKYVPVKIEIEKVLYLAETFVNPNFRRQGISTQLYNMKLKIAKQDDFKYLIERTSFNSKMFPLIKKSGFKTIGEENIAVERIIDGKLIKVLDRRIISFKKL
ncbi:GNAT family N-acetyltransferase [bacterium]|nr:GNAT family N-acetyltransferase [bacterium]